MKLRGLLALALAVLSIHPHAHSQEISSLVVTPVAWSTEDRTVIVQIIENGYFMSYERCTLRGEHLSLGEATVAQAYAELTELVRMGGRCGERTAKTFIGNEGREQDEILGAMNRRFERYITSLVGENIDTTKYDATQLGAVAVGITSWTVFSSIQMVRFLGVITGRASLSRFGARAGAVSLAATILSVLVGIVITQEEIENTKFSALAFENLRVQAFREGARAAGIELTDVEIEALALSLSGTDAMNSFWEALRRTMQDANMA